MIQRIFASLIFLSCLGQLTAQDAAENEKTSVVRKYSNEFLSIGVGARALGMANSCVATCNDVTSAYWNPSSITFINEDLQLGAMHAEYFAGIGKYDYLGGAARINDSSSFGISAVRFGVDDIPNTLDLVDSEGNVRYDRITSFSVADYAFLLSYARLSAIHGLRYGANVKVIRRKAGIFASAWGFGFDASARYDMGNWRFGAVIRDVTSTFNAWSFNTEELEEAFLLTGNELPENSLELTLPKLIIGGAYQFNLGDKFGGLAEIDADLTFDGMRNVMVKSDYLSIDPHIGLEFNFRQLVFIRAGVLNMQYIEDFDGTKYFSLQPNLGMGLKIKRLAIDYAFTDIGDASIALYSHVFSLTYAINKIPGKVKL
ncbi:MAG: PorV/PorQ family protein [Bacteroidetes bacterium]|nr:PorV/PorQ family protein [Bacteroidota bacterium]